MIIIGIWIRLVTFVCMRRWFSEIYPNSFILRYFTSFYHTPGVRKNSKNSLFIYVLAIYIFFHFNQIIIVVSKSHSEYFYFVEYYASPYGYNTWTSILYYLRYLVCLSRI